MKLIIDSGSTKADWALVNHETLMLKSPGMNPCFINREEITAIILSTIMDKVDGSSVKQIYFYGAGCAEASQKSIVSDAFLSVFNNATIQVEVDTMAAVHATCGDLPGIACILGTGCNSVLFNGKTVEPNNYGLGFILADEGAGTYLGKKLITNYLYGILPSELSEKFREKYSLTREMAITNCYSKPNPGTWLASFSEFLFEHKKHPWVINAVSEGFVEFMHLYVMNYPAYEKLPVHFIGSIAFLYRDILADAARTCKVQLGNVIQRPMDGLMSYH